MILIYVHLLTNPRRRFAIDSHLPFNEGEGFMPITRAAQAPHFDLDGFHFVGLTAPSRGATELCTWQLNIAPGAGAADEAHQLNHEEVFIVLDGTITVTVEQEDIELGVGDALAVPAHSWLLVRNCTAVPARAIVCVPVGVRGRFINGREIGTPPWAQ
jgi:mannose-6-phosphate isomerase-like protein (cupin superfamily)